MTAGGRRPRVSGAALPGGGHLVRQLLASNQGAQSNLRPRLYGPWCLIRMASNLYLETALKTSLMNASLQLEPYKHREDNMLKVYSHGQSSRFHYLLV